MPRANRICAPEHVFHITHRCHKKEFLLKFKKDRDRYRYWLYEAKKRYGLCVLNYVVTSNHIHLLVKDTGKDVIASSMQLVASRTAQEYNQRKKRHGAFWEDRYHATIVEVEDYLHRCFLYIDLNMVRAGVVTHPQYWVHSGYNDIYNERNRYQLLCKNSLLELFDFQNFYEFRATHREWLEQALVEETMMRNPIWTEERIVGSELFVKSF